MHYRNTKIKCAAIVFPYGSQHTVKHQIHLKHCNIVTSATLSVIKKFPIKMKIGTIFSLHRNVPARWMENSEINNNVDAIMKT